MQNRISLSVSPRLLLNLLCALATLAGFGVLAGCGDAASDAPFETVFNPCQPLAIVAQPGTNAAQLQSLDAAITMWNERADLQLTRVEDTQLTPNAPHIPVHFEDAAAFMHGYYSDELGVVTVNRKLNPRQYTITAAHELGHAFGLHHVAKESRTSLMNHANLDTELTPTDVQTLHALWPSCGLNPAPENP